jgi:hypothetical protein
MGETCSTHGKYEKCIQSYSRETQKEQTGPVLDWINMVQDWVQWRFLVNTVMNIMAP